MRKAYIFARLAFVFLVSACFYLLAVSRSGEAHTVWEVLNPAFAPVFLMTALLLVGIVFSSERVEVKLVFIVFFSILVHSFFAVIFPAGVVGFQQAVLGVARRIFDNSALHGYGGMAPNIATRVYNWFGAQNFQSVYSVMFARMFGVDVLWSHLFLVPVLWGVFVPMFAFLIADRLFSNERVSVLSSLLSAAFPLLLNWGTISVPNSLGYVFFLASLYFTVRYISSGEKKVGYLLILLVFVSFRAHPLTGIMSIVFVFLGFVLSVYRRERTVSPWTARFMLAVSLLVSEALLPFALIFLQFFSPSYAYFGLSNIVDLSLGDIVGLFVFGDYWNYQLSYALVSVVGPVLGLIGAVYVLWRSREAGFNRRLILLLFLGLIVVWVDYRVLELFMVRVPFEVERVWVIRDFVVLGFAAVAVGEFIVFVRDGIGRLKLPRLKFVVLKLWSLALIVLVGGWLFVSLFYSGAYPYYSSLQTTWYEIDAVKYIDANAGQRYVVIGDQYFTLAGLVFVGVSNPRAYYFPAEDSVGARLFQDMRTNVTTDVMVRAMAVNNSSLAFFALQSARWPAEYDGVVEKASVNNVATFKVFYDSNGVEKCRVFYYSKS